MSNIKSKAMTAAEIAALATTVIPLPPFEEGGPEIQVRVKRPNLMSMIAQKKIPNELLSLVMESGGATEAVHQQVKSGDPQEALQLMEILIDATLVEPKYSEIKDLLTDEQKAELLAYAGGGVKALTSFRSGPGQPVEAGSDSQSVEQATE